MAPANVHNHLRIGSLAAFSARIPVSDVRMLAERAKYAKYNLPVHDFIEGGGLPLFNSECDPCFRCRISTPGMPTTPIFGGQPEYELQRWSVHPGRVRRSSRAEWSTMLMMAGGLFLLSICVKMATSA
jgi:hypothetical protein